MVRFIKWLLVTLVVLVVISLGAIRYIGAWNLVFPNRTHDSVAPVLPSDLPSSSILLFTKTNGFRHSEGITGGTEVISALAEKHGWGLFHTENGAVFNAADLESFSTVVFLNASGNMLSTEQELAFQSWLESGGGWLGLHAAGDDSHKEWRWYRENLIGADFTAHTMGPQFQVATVILENHDHPAIEGLPNVWDHSEEWYSWAASPREEGFLILATLDEDSYNPEVKMFGKTRDLRMGDHPVVWTNCVGEGRSIYAAMGHQAEAFAQPQIRSLLENTLLWLANPGPGPCVADALPDSEL